MQLRCMYHMMRSSMPALAHLPGRLWTWPLDASWYRALLVAASDDAHARERDSCLSGWMSFTLPSLSRHAYMHMAHSFSQLVLLAADLEVVVHARW